MLRWLADLTAGGGCLCWWRGGHTWVIPGDSYKASVHRGIFGWWVADGYCQHCTTYHYVKAVR